MFEIKQVRHTHAPSAEPIIETPPQLQPLDGTATAAVPVETGIMAALRQVNRKNVSDLVFAQTAVVLTGFAYLFLVPEYEKTLTGLLDPEAMQWPMRSVCAVSHFFRDHPSIVALFALAFTYQLFWSMKRWRESGSPERHWIHWLNTHKHAHLLFNIVLVLPMAWFGIAVGSQMWALVKLLERIR